MNSAGSGQIAVRRATGEEGQCARRARFERFVREHEARVAGLAWRLLGWRDDVDDVVQDVFLQALRSLDGFRGEARVETWLTRVTINACRSHRRRRLLRLRVLAEFADRAGRGDRGRGPDADSGGSTAHAGAAVEDARLLRAAVGKLPMRDREVIVLRYLQEMEVGEIADVLRLRPNAVEVRLTRARRRLRRIMSEMRPDMESSDG